MRLISSIFIVLLQCASISSFAAKGHTTNNGGNLAEIRFTEAWNGFEAAMAPCLTKANVCTLSADQLRMIRTALANKPVIPMVMPVDELLYRAGGEPKSETEMTEVVLAILQDCGGSLSTASVAEIAAKARAVVYYKSVVLYGRQVWHVFDSGRLVVEDVNRTHDLTARFHGLLRLPATAKINFERLWVRENGGLIEIGGRISYERGIAKNNGFTFLINPYVDGTMPADIQLTVFR